MSSLSVLGLGAMGRALTRAAAAAGHDVTVWNRTPERADGVPATPVPDPAAAIGAADLVVLCLLDRPSVDAVLDAAGDAVAGRTVVNLTTTDPDDARAVAERVTAAGGHAVDGGIMAVPPMIGDDAALVLYSGDEAAFRAGEPVLRAFGRTRFLGPDPASASLYDFALLSGMYGMFAGAEHAQALLRASGVADERFVADLLQPWLRATLESLGTADDADSNAAMQLTGVRQMLATSRRRGVDEVLDGHLRSAIHALQTA